MLCDLCKIFTEYVLDGKLGDIDRWRPLGVLDYESSSDSVARPQISEDGKYLRPCCFIHYSRYSNLVESANAGCQLCALIRNSSGPLEQRAHRDRRGNAPVCLWLSPMADSDAYKRFKVCMGKNASPFERNVLELEYYQRCGRPFLTSQPFIHELIPLRDVPDFESPTGYESVRGIRNFAICGLGCFHAACPALARYMH